MMIFTMSNKIRRSFALIALLVALAAANGNVFAQEVYTRPSSGAPQSSPTPFVKPIVKQVPTLVTQPSLPPRATTTTTAPQPNGAPSNSAANAAVADIAVPSLEPVVAGMRGVLVETLDGQLVMANDIDSAYNPASNVKVATALAVLNVFGANYRVKTQVFTDGIVDATTGTVTGNLVVIGNDPSMQYEHAVAIAEALNKIGIRQVTGDLLVAPTFTMNYNGSAVRSGVVFYDTLDATRRSAAAVRAWQEHHAATKPGQPFSIPSVAVMGQVGTDVLPTNLRLLVAHESSPLKDILKACLSYSNNFLAERLGDMVGGSYGVEQIVERVGRIPTEEVQFASSSGLGMNRVTPRAMMKIFRALHNELAKNRLSPTDILPVAGIDEGTLKNRFTNFRERGSVIGKTGTLPNTDNGVSSLVGQIATAKGEILFFVIFNQRGNVNRFRAYQDDLVTYLQNSRGGAATFSYHPKSFSTIYSSSKTTPEKSLLTRNE
jgi:serine-type D-Ala-D-Ala carboxypeptidase/endopeptidase (penicillin-binding protein 4)